MSGSGTGASTGTGSGTGADSGTGIGAESGAAVGEVYDVYRGIVRDTAAFGPKVHRPVVCVVANKHRPAVGYWRGVSRTSSTPISGDPVLASPAQDLGGLNKPGHWQFRWVHEVLKSKVGTKSCLRIASLDDAERKAVLKCYRDLADKTSVLS